MSPVMKLDLQEMGFELGRWTGEMNAILDNLHTCRFSYLKHPWPLDPKCDGCRRELQKFVDRNHLTMAHRLLGWQPIVEHMQRDIQRRIDEAQARRNVGSGI